MPNQSSAADQIDKALVVLAQQGDKQAFDILVQKYQFKILKLISRYVRDPMEAKDVTQDAFIKAYRALPRFRGDSGFYTWLYRIAINCAKNHLILKDQHLVDTDIDGLDMDFILSKGAVREFTSPEGNVVKNELELVVGHAIDKLPNDLKTTIRLREQDGLSYCEIAGVMGCPVGTVRSRIFRAREAIERHIRHIVE